MTAVTEKATDNRDYNYSFQHKYSGAYVDRVRGTTGDGQGWAMMAGGG